jgi:hypothetical protein
MWQRMDDDLALELTLDVHRDGTARLTIEAGPLRITHECAGMAQGEHFAAVWTQALQFWSDCERRLRSHAADD